MPVDLEMILSVSPPVYPYRAFVESGYPFNTNENYDHSYKIQEKKFLNNNVSQFNQEYAGLGISAYDVAHGSEDTLEEDTPNQTKLKGKKKVSFADDKGLALVEVRSIPTVSPQPRMYPQDFLSMITERITPKVPTEKKWKIAFPNPPYTASTLQEQLDGNLVALDSVSVAEGQNDILSGRIKVKNTSFEKKVFVRITFDRWVSYEDIPATYVNSKDSEKNENQTVEPHDVFEFSACINPSAFRYEVVEFCVGYTTNGRHCWDNNGGINYRLVATSTGKTYKTSRQVSQILSHNPEPKYDCAKSKYTPIADPFDVSTGIDTWNSFLGERPYW